MPPSTAENPEPSPPPDSPHPPKPEAAATPPAVLNLPGFPPDLKAILHVEIARIQASAATAKPLAVQSESGLHVHDGYLQIEFLGLVLEEIESLTVGILALPQETDRSDAPWEAVPAAHSLLRVTLREPLDPTRLSPEAGWESVRMDESAVFRSVAAETSSQVVWQPDPLTLLAGPEDVVRRAIRDAKEPARQYVLPHGDAELFLTLLPDALPPAAETDASPNSNSRQEFLERFRTDGRRFSLTGRFAAALRTTWEFEFNSPETASSGRESLERLLAELRDSLGNPDSGSGFLRPILEPLLSQVKFDLNGTRLLGTAEVSPETAAMVAGQLPWLAFLGRSSALRDDAGDSPERGRTFDELVQLAVSPVESTTGETPLEIRGIAERQAVFTLLPDAPADQRRLAFLLILSGERAADVVAYRPPVLERAETAPGRLKRAHHSDAIPAADGTCLVETPVAGRDAGSTAFPIPMAFHLPVAPFETLSEVSGRCTLLVAGRRVAKSIPGLERAVNEGIHDPDLIAAGIKIGIEEIAFDEPVRAYVVQVGKAAGLRDLRAVDSQGNPLSQAWISADVAADGTRRFLIGAVEGKLPEDVGLQLTLLEDLREEQLTFLFRDVPIAPDEHDSGTAADAATGPREVWTPALNQSEMPKEMFVDGQLRWSRFVSFSPTGEHQPRNLELAVDVTGPGVGLPVAIGMLEVLRAKSNGIRWKLAEPASSQFPGWDSELAPYDPLGLTGDIPPDGLQALFTFLPPERPPLQLDEVRVAFTFVTAESRHTIEIDDLPAALDHPLDHPGLSERGIRLTPHRNGRQIALHFEGDDPFIIQEIQPLTPDRQPRDDIYSGRNRFGESHQFLLVAEGELPESLPVRIVLNENPRRERIEAYFESLPIPRPPVENP